MNINVKPLDIDEASSLQLDDCSLSTISCSPRKPTRESDSPNEAPEPVKEEEKPKSSLKQVFQGKFMRKDASLWSKMTFSYPKPLLDAAMEGDISFAQYGELPEEMKIDDKVKEMQASIDYYIK